MKVRHGWSGQVSSSPDRWAKLDVELEEEDLRRILTQAGLPAELVHSLPTSVAFTLLEAEAEIMILFKLKSSYGYTEGDERMTKLAGTKNSLIVKLREQQAGIGTEINERGCTDDPQELPD